MSIHSNVQSYNKEPDISHLNHAQDPPQPRSAQPAQPMGGPSQYLWVATYIDGQYYLTDPQSMAKLKNIEAELEQERQRLAQLEHDNLSQNDSFLSLQDQRAEAASNNSFCNTEFNESAHLNRQERVKQDLEHEEDKYREKLRNMQKKKFQISQNIAYADKHLAHQNDTPQHQIDPHTQDRILISKHQAQPEAKIQESAPLETDKSVKSATKTMKESEKSHHKLRMELSNKQNSQQQHILNSQRVPAEPKSVKFDEVKSGRPQNEPPNQQKAEKSETGKALQQLDVEKKKQSETNSVKPSEKKLTAEKQPSAKAHSIKPAQPIDNKSEKSELITSRLEDKSIYSKKSQRNIKQSDADFPQALRPEKEPSVRSSSKKSHLPINPTEKSASKKYEVVVIDPQGKKAEEVQSVKNKEREDVTSKKSAVSKQSSANSPLKSEKKSKIAEEDINSNKSQIVEQKQEKQDARSIKSSKLEEAAFQPPKSQKSHKISQKSHQFIADDAESKKSNLPADSKNNRSHQIQPDIEKSVKIQQDNLHDQSHLAVPDEGRSKRSHVIEHSEVKSKKSHQSEAISDAPMKKLSIIERPEDVNSQIIAQKSHKSKKKEENEDLKSKKSVISEYAQEKSVKKAQSINQSQQKSRLKESAQQILNHQQVSDKKSEAKQPSVKDIANIDKSIQWSRMTEHIQETSKHINEIKFPAGSEKNSSFIEHNDQSMNQSSHIKLQQLNNQIPIQNTTDHMEYNMKKKKEEPLETQQEKKGRSFVIHSRHGSVKERSEKNYSRRKHSSKKSNHQPSEFSKLESAADSMTKGEIAKLHEQILILQDKLKKVEERQEQIDKLESNLNKFQHQELMQQPISQVSLPIQQPAPQTPIINLSEVVKVGLKIQPRLQLESSIIQVNTAEEQRKKVEKETEGQEKNKLKEEIDRLKKIIRDLQIEKIKSIDHDNELADSALLKSPLTSRVVNPEPKQIEKESNSSHQHAIQRSQWGSSTRKARLVEQAGKIIHIPSPLNDITTPRRRLSQKSRLTHEQQALEINDLPAESYKKNQKHYNEIRRHDLVDRLQQKDNQFHHFIESSRVIAEEGFTRHESTEQPSSHLAAPFTSFSKIGVDAPKINYSRMVEEMKKTNPQEDQVLPEIHLRDLKAPELPPTPHADMTQEHLLELAKSTYKVFGIDVDEQDRQLCVKKYKNCVVFTLSNQPAECVLWHFSGKFYMGGWKSGEGAEGEKNGEGVEIIPDKHIYRGQFLNGKKHGTGIIRLLNGNLYDGQWIEGMKNGSGVYFDAATRVVYSGEWRDGKKDGHGFLKLSEKEYYYGTFVKSVKEGFGSEVFINGDKYKGEYRAGKFHGKGKYIWANGSCYEGQFSEGVRQGQGSWKSAKANGDIYIGTYQADKKNGYGRYVWANGCMYQGGFSNDLKHGRGRLTYQDGKEIKGAWEDGNLVTTESNKKQSAEPEDQPLRKSLKSNSFHPSLSKRF